MVDRKRNIIIKDKFIHQRYDNTEKRKNKKKWYKFRCNTCGWEDGSMKESNLKIGNGCACCSGKKIVRGVNDIATTHNFLVKYFSDKEIAYTIGAGSHKSIEIQCPDCGFSKELLVSNFIKRNGFQCPVCSDKTSFGEKIKTSLIF